MHTPVRA